MEKKTLFFSKIKKIYQITKKREGAKIIDIISKESLSL